MYINAKELVEWLLTKYGSGRGVEAQIAFDIMEYIADAEQIEIKEETNNE